MKNKLIAANWKMNCTVAQADALFTEIHSAVSNLNIKDTHVVICPPALYIKEFAGKIYSTCLSIGAQNCYFENKGAYTGELSAEMIKSCGAKYCIVGHSERRSIFSESNDWILKKTKSCLLAQLKPIICIGEPLDIREKGTHLNFIQEQFNAVYNALSNDEAKETVIAYEPVWAIGTGKTASPAQAQEAHAYIRKLIAEKYNQQTADNFTIIYGGSCNENNAKELFSCKDIDGGLIGGASLKADSFINIIHAAG